MLAANWHTGPVTGQRFGSVNLANDVHPRRTYVHCSCTAVQCSPDAAEAPATCTEPGNLVVQGSMLDILTLQY